MIELLIKASFAIGIALLFYKLLLQQESFFAANRLYLLGCVVLAFVLPFVTLPKIVEQQGYLSTLFQEKDSPDERIAKVDKGASELLAAEEMIVTTPENYTTQSSEIITGQAAATAKDTSAEISWVSWLVMLYLFGVAVFALNLFFQIGAILYKVFTATDKIRDGDYVIVNTESRQAPCSFFRYIFIYPDDYDFETYEQIIAHEKIHARLGHTLDLLIAEAAVIVLWFNPLVWFLKREIEKNSEYQTDAQLLEKEQVPKDQYQLNLLQIAVPNKPLRITTNYNQSLIKQRIMMMNAKRSNMQAYWKYAFLAPLFFGTTLIMNEPAVSQDKPKNRAALVPAPVPAPSPEAAAAPLPEAPSVPAPEAAPLPAAMPFPDKMPGDKGKAGKVYRNSMNITGQADMSEGYWYSNSENGDYCIQFRGSKNSSGWNMSRCFKKENFQRKGNDVYVLTKETGTLQLTGNLSEEVGQGTFTFTEDASFRKFLADNNITTSTDSNMMFLLFFGNVNRQYVTFLKKNYGEVSGKRLIELAIHGISINDFQSYLALFEKYSNTKPSVQEVVNAKIHGIDQAYVQELQSKGFDELSLKKMMTAKIHGVNGEYIESLKRAGFENLTIDKIISAKIHGISPAKIKKIQGLGFEKLSLDKIIELTIHDVDAAFINDLRSAGFEDLSLDQYVEAKIHGLNAASIKEIKALGYNDLDFRDIVSARIHGVNADYVADLKKAGFDNLSMNKTIAAKIHGIDSKFVEKARKNGYNLNSIDKYISLKIHGMAMESLKDD